MSSEITVSKKFRILVDAKNRIYHLISFWTKAVDVFFNSGKNAQDTLGNIYGISDSLTSTSSNIAASTAAIKAINDKVTNVALGNATQADVLAPKTFSSNVGITKTGTMANLSGAVGYSNVADGTTFARIVLGNTGKITQGTSYVDVPTSVLKSNVADLNKNCSRIEVYMRQSILGHTPPTDYRDIKVILYDNNNSVIYDTGWLGGFPANTNPTKFIDVSF